MRMVGILVPPLLMMVHSFSLPPPPMGRPEGREITNSSSNQGGRAVTLEGGGEGEHIHPTGGEWVHHADTER